MMEDCNLSKLPKSVPFFAISGRSFCVENLISTRLFNAILNYRYHIDKDLLTRAESVSDPDGLLGDVLRIDIKKFKNMKGVGWKTFKELEFLLTIIE